MSAFQRGQRRFACQGVNVVKAFDDLPAGKYGFLSNVRSYVQGEITSRFGLTAVGAAVGATIHSIQRFDDSSSFAANPHLIVLGVGAALRTGPAAGPFVQVDAGYSGNPLALVAATPPNSPQPWLYVGDSSQYHKIDANGHVFVVGLAPPIAAPDVRDKLGALGMNIIAQFSGGFVPWVSVGSAAAAIAGPNNRTNTGISQIIYDALSGVGPGYASIVPIIWDGIAEGELVTIKNIETVAVTQVTIPVATTTIAGILYDAGATGLCTIQPAASLGTGQLDAPSMEDYAARAAAAGTIDIAIPRGTAGTPPAPSPSLTRIRQVDFPVNCLVSLGNTETVRILSVALGPDGVQSFRCLTNSPHVAGESIVGLTAFRCFTAGTYAAADHLGDSTLFNIITPPPPVGTAPQQATAGIRTGAGFGALNLAQINGRATLPDDDVHLTVRFNLCPPIQTVRLYLSLEATAGTAPNNATDFTQDYFFYEWRQSDIAAAIQTQNTDVVATLQAIRPTVVGNAQLNQHAASQRNPNFVNQPGAGLNTAQSAVIAVGNAQWLELRCKVRDLQRVGTDPSLTLGNVTAAEVLVSIEGPNAIQVDYDAIWLSGGFGPDVQATGTPYVYRGRYRSSRTGAVSNPSPASLGGIIPRRQRVSPTLVASADPQVDLIDWFRLGGVLTTWTYVGTVPNAAPTLADDYPDSQIDGGEELSFTQFQPWPDQDLPRTGTCNIVGNAIQWVSGDVFNTAWNPGSTIIVNNKPYTLYAQPSSATRLFINENAGLGVGVPFTLPGPTLLGQPLASVWGGPIGGATFLFGCRDTTNPGTVHWTNANNSEASQEANSLDVTPASEPLQNGYIHDKLPYVASTDEVYVLEPNFGGTTSSFRPLATGCGRGFWTPWAFALGPEGCYFLAKDGIYLTAGGLAEPITDDDLYPLFPHDGVPGSAANGYNPPDMTQTTRLRLAYIDGWLYFDYKDTNGTPQTLAYRRADKSWWPDVYPDGVVCRESATGASVHQMLIGANSQLAVPGGITDLGVPIVSQVEIVDNQGDARRQKLYRDFMIDAQRAAPITVTLGFTNNGTVLPGIAVPGVAGRFQYPLSTGLERTGIYGSNITALIVWTPIITETTILFDWDVAYQPGPELSTNWLSGPTTFGLNGFKQIPRVRIAYISNAPAQFSLIIDGTTYLYNLPSSAGLYAKNEIVLQAVKGMTFQAGLAGGSFQLFDSDCEFLVQPWGQGGGYQTVRPF